MRNADATRTTTLSSIEIERRGGICNGLTTKKNLDRNWPINKPEVERECRNSDPSVGRGQKFGNSE